MYLPKKVNEVLKRINTDRSTYKNFIVKMLKDKEKIIKTAREK